MSSEAKHNKPTPPSSRRIVHEVKGIRRVLHDLSGKPSATDLRFLKTALIDGYMSS
jgi:hypothetical protein